MAPFNLGNVWHSIESPFERLINRTITDASNIGRNIENVFNDDIKKPVASAVSFIQKEGKNVEDFASNSVFPEVEKGANFIYDKGSKVADFVYDEGKGIVGGANKLGDDFVDIAGSISKTSEYLPLIIGGSIALLIIMQNK